MLDVLPSYNLGENERLSDICIHIAVGQRAEERPPDVVALGETPTEFPAPRSSREDSPFQTGIQGVEAIVLTDHRPVISQFVLEVIGRCPFLGDVLT